MKVLVSLPDRLVEITDKHAEKEFLKRSQYIAQALKHYIHFQDRKEQLEKST